MSSEKKETNYFFLMCVLFILITILWVSYQYWLPFVSNINGGVNNLNNNGVFGDSYGALNTLFSGLAFCGIIISIFLQSQELKETRNEVRGQKEALQKQNFEQTFFQLLNTHNQIIDSIDLAKEGSITTTGRDCFKVFYARFKGEYLSKQGRINGSNELSKIQHIYRLYYKDIQQDTGHYFLFLYNMVKFVHEKCNSKDAKYYTNLIRAQLCYDELGLIFYNCIGVMDDNKFKPLIEKYGLLKNLPDDTLIKKEHKELYQGSAFK